MSDLQRRGNRIKDARREQQIAAGTWIYRQEAETYRLLIADARARGMSVPAIAQATGVPRGTLYNLTAGRCRQVFGETARRLDKLVAVATPPAGFVDATGTRRRIEALAAMGYSLRTQRRRSGLSNAAFHRLLHGSTRHVAMRSEAAVRAMYREWAVVPGPSKHARTWAKKYGWASPAAWDDIDDPACTPNLGDVEPTEPVVDEVAVQRVLAGRARLCDVAADDQAATCRRLADQGLTVGQIAYRTGTSTHRVRALLGQPGTRPEAQPAAA